MRDDVAARVRAIVADRAETVRVAWRPAPRPEADPGGAHRADGRAVLRWRVDPGRRAAVAMGLVAVLVAAVAVWWLLSDRPRAAAVTTSAPTPSASASHTTAAAAVVVVDVSGRVHRPGLYRLPAGSRVDDALRAAGQALPGVDLTSLNLARRVSDGEQIAVGVPLAPASLTGSAGTPPGPVDLNTATLEQLDALPGVGPVLAQHVLDWRAAHGRFDSVDQLREVSGIGPAKYADLSPLVTV